MSPHNGSPRDAREIEPRDVIKRRQAHDSLLVLDCREPQEWREMRIPASLHMPMSQIPQRLQELDRDADIVVVCAHGVRSLVVADYLRHQGLDARSLRGGLSMWIHAGGPVDDTPLTDTR